MLSVIVVQMFCSVAVVYIDRYVDMAFPALLGNLAAVRTVRVLRALKTVAIVPGL